MTLAARVCYPFAASSNRPLPFAYGQELGKGNARQLSVELYRDDADTPRVDQFLCHFPMFFQ